MATNKQLICLRDQARSLRHIGTTGNSAECCQGLFDRSTGNDRFQIIADGSSGEALDEMLFASGKLNIKLLGGARDMIER